MKIICYIIAVGGVSLKAAPFVNLDFDSPRRPLTPFELPTERALPGWTAYTGTTIENRILYHNAFLGSAGLELRDESFLANGKVNYSVTFYSGGSLYGEGGVPTGIFQTGDVPATAKTLLFQADLVFRPSEINRHFRVTLDGVTLSLQPVTGRTFGADISAFAGKTAELRFQANWRSDQEFGQVYFHLDDIRFSPVVLVPEPSTWALLGVGGGLLFWVAKRPKAT